MQVWHAGEQHTAGGYSCLARLSDFCELVVLKVHLLGIDTTLYLDNHCYLHQAWDEAARQGPCLDSILTMWSHTRSVASRVDTHFRLTLRQGGPGGSA